MYGMTNSVKLFADELTEWSIEAGSIKCKFHMSIYYKYSPDGFFLFYLMLMTVYIGILLNILENGLWIL